MAGAFDESDKSVQVTHERTEHPVEIDIRENPDGSGAPVSVYVHVRVTEGSHVTQETRRVPQDVINNNWPGPLKTLKDYCLLLIDLAE